MVTRYRIDELLKFPQNITEKEVLELLNDLAAARNESFFLRERLRAMKKRTPQNDS